MCNEAVNVKPLSLGFVPDHLKTQEMCNEAVKANPYTLWYVPDQYKTQAMCDNAMCKNPAAFFSYSRPLQDSRDNIWGGPWLVWGTTRNVAWGDDGDYYDDYLIEWYEGGKGR